MGPDHTPLSKRHGATSVAEFRERGYLPEALTNYLALIGWSPRPAAAAPDDAELLPIDELARRFALEDVGHSAGVFDLEKLAWMNRHYMKAARAGAAGGGVARASSIARGFVERTTDVALAYIESLLPMAVGSVDRLEEIPDRLAFLFDLRRRRPRSQRPDVAEVVREPGARDVIAALAEAIDAPLARSRDVPRDGQPREGADRAEGQGAVPSDPRRADGRGRRPGARPRRAGDRARRGSSRRTRALATIIELRATARVRSRQRRRDLAHGVAAASSARALA